MKHMLSLMDWSPDELDRMVKLAIMVKGDQDSYRAAIDGQTLAMIFEKPSTRTRVSFEIGKHPVVAIVMKFAQAFFEIRIHIHDTGPHIRRLLVASASPGNPPEIASQRFRASGPVSSEVRLAGTFKLFKTA